MCGRCRCSRSAKVSGPLEVGFGPGDAIRLAAEAAPSCRIAGVAHSATMRPPQWSRNSGWCRFCWTTDYGSALDECDETAACPRGSRRFFRGRSRVIAVAPKKARRPSRRAFLHTSSPASCPCGLVNSRSSASPRTAGHNHPPAATGYRPASRPGRACRRAKSRSGRRSAVLRRDRA